MELLSYSPSIEVYAVVGGDESLVDLSRDVVTANVSRKEGGASTFEVRLQNVGNKYNGFFLPMDRVKIYATKVDRYPLLSGYVTKVPAYTMYGEDVTISGCCPIYRLQKYYWDPGLVASQEALGRNNTEKSWDGVIINLLTKVAGIPEPMISLGDVPDSVIKWAASLYAAHTEDATQLKDMVNDFFDVLKTHGPAVSGAGAGAATGAAAGFSATPAGAVQYTGIDFSLSESAFVSKWGPRIDAYYSSHYPDGALKGHGSTIAREGYRNNVDPRIVVAISVGETGGGSVSAKRGVHGQHNYWSWGCYPGSEIKSPSIGIWSGTVDDAIAEFCQKFSRRYAGKTPAECAALGYGEVDYILATWPPIMSAI